MIDERTDEVAERHADQRIGREVPPRLDARPTGTDGQHIEADVERCRTNAESSPAIATSLNPYLGYERTAQLIKESQKTGTPIRELVKATGEISDEDLDRALDATALTRGGLPPSP